jgi:hypothetical protein
MRVVPQVPMQIQPNNSVSAALLPVPPAFLPLLARLVYHLTLYKIARASLSAVKEFPTIKSAILADCIVLSVLIQHAHCVIHLTISRAMSAVPNALQICFPLTI